MDSLFSGLFTTFLPMLARSALKFIGGAAIAWLVAKHVDPTQANNLVGYASGFVMTGIGIWLSQRNQQSNTAKVEVAGAAGVTLGRQIAAAQVQGEATQQSADQAHADAVAQAIALADKAAPKTKAALLASLRA